jgi:hypothetical protein
MSTTTKPDNDCSVCDGRLTGSRPESARILVSCTTCGTRACNSPCFAVHRGKPLPPRRLGLLARARAWWNAGRVGA